MKKSDFLKTTICILIILSIGLINVPMYSFSQEDSNDSQITAFRIVYGDLNGDGRVNSIDLTILRRYLLEIIDINDIPISNFSIVADLNGDGRVNTTDYTLLKRYLLGIIDIFPVEESNSSDFVTYNVGMNGLVHGKVIEVDPRLLRNEIVNQRYVQGDYVNGTFFGSQNDQVVSVGAMVNNGVLIARRLEHDNVARGTFIVYTNGTVSVKNITDIDKEENLSGIRFATTGFNLFPLNLQGEWWPTSYADATFRTVLGYNPTINKAMIFSFSTRQTSANQAIQILQGLGCTMGIGLDGGGSTGARFNGENLRTPGRVIHNVIRWN
ncbi:UNVERIFIED_CONTAM: dockerin type I repeat protein [Acetivibrio alkalicellulosi]